MFYSRITNLNPSKTKEKEKKGLPTPIKKTGIDKKMTLSELQNLLKKFEDQFTVKNQAVYLIEAINKIKEEKLSEPEFTELNKQLEKWVKDQTFVQLTIKLAEDTITFSQLLNKIRLTLPHNITDFATFDPINPEDKDSFITSDNYLFNIFSLGQWIETKGAYHHPYKGDLFSEEDRTEIADFYKNRTGKVIDLSHPFHNDRPDLVQDALEEDALRPALIVMGLNSNQLPRLPFLPLPPVFFVTPFVTMSFFGLNRNNLHENDRENNENHNSNTPRPSW